jgi:hypothetical protein
MKVSGKVTVTGVQATAAYTGMLATANKVTEVDLSDSATGGETKDGAGSYLNISTSGRMHKTTITLIPFDPASPGTLATAKSKVVLPAPMEKVTITDTDLAILTGDWHYAKDGGGSIRIANDGQSLRITLPIERYEPVGGGAPAYLGDPI